MKNAFLYSLIFAATIFSTHSVKAQSINIKNSANSSSKVTITIGGVSGESASFFSTSRDSVIIHNPKGAKIGHIDCSAGITDGVIELYATGLNSLYLFESEDKCLETISAVEAALSRGKTVVVTADKFTKSILSIDESSTQCK